MSLLKSIFESFKLKKCVSGLHTQRKSLIARILPRGGPCSDGFRLSQLYFLHVDKHTWAAARERTPVGRLYVTRFRHSVSLGLRLLNSKLLLLG